jgi:hypothetical protein
LFPNFKFSVKGHQFQTVGEIEENSIWDLRDIQKNTFQDGFQNWKKKFGTVVSIVEGSILKGTSFVKL